jgi:hypothetical protein
LAANIGDDDASEDDEEEEEDEDGGVVGSTDESDDRAALSSPLPSAAPCGLASDRSTDIGGAVYGTRYLVHRHVISRTAHDEVHRVRARQRLAETRLVDHRQ